MSKKKKGTTRKKRLRYRSEFERRVAAAARKNRIKLQYEPFVIEWTPKIKKYLPDFVLDNGIIIEVKGRLTDKSILRYDRATRSWILDLSSPLTTN